MKTMTTLVTAAGFVLSLSLTAATAQDMGRRTDARWDAWLGCWQLAEESVQDAAALLPDRATAARANRVPRICVTPADGGGAVLTTLVGDAPTFTETIVADGERRATADAACRGWQASEWSAVGPRIYSRGEIACGSQPARTISGLGALVSGPQWVDIQVVESQGRKSVRVRRYQRAAAPGGPAGSRLADAAAQPLPARLSLADITEAATRVAPEVLQAAVLELGQGGYDINARRLLELDAAGVPDSVTDLMVALSFPQRFEVSRAGASSFGADPWNTWWDPAMFYSGLFPFYAMWPYYDGFGYGYRSLYSSYFSPFGFHQWGYYDPYALGVPGVVVIGNGGSDVEPSGSGRVVDGQGYTRIRRVAPEPSTRVPGEGGGWTTSSSGSGSNAGSSGGVSSGGYSGGGSGSGERVAVPRPPGGR